MDRDQLRVFDQRILTVVHRYGICLTSMAIVALVMLAAVIIALPTRSEVKEAVYEGIRDGVERSVDKRADKVTDWWKDATSGDEDE